MTEVYKITVLQPHADMVELASVSDAVILAAFSVVLMAALMSFYATVGRRILSGDETRTLRTGRNYGGILTAMILCLTFTTQEIAFCQQSQELTVIGPADNVLGGTIKEISQSFSDANNIPVNITQMRGREMVVKEVSKNKSDADVVILEKTFPLFNLTGMDKLENKMLIDNCAYLYSEKALLIFQKDEAIDSLSDLDGMIVAVTDQHVPGACLAKKIVDKEGLNVSEVNESSNEAQLDAVAAGRADATVLWESMFESYANSINPKIKVIDLEDYRMDNYIAILNRSDNLAEAEMYVKYLLAALATNSSGNKI
jgi:ABC-type phosphate/phosphonate transport system substrate-binding protein